MSEKLDQLQSDRKAQRVRIAENSSITLGLLVAILGGLVIGAVHVGAVAKQVEINSADIVTLKGTQTVIVEIRTDIAVIKDQLSNIQNNQANKK